MNKDFYEGFKIKRLSKPYSMCPSLSIYVVESNGRFHDSWKVEQPQDLPGPNLDPITMCILGKTGPHAFHSQPSLLAQHAQSPEFNSQDCLNKV